MRLRPFVVLQAGRGPRRGGLVGQAGGIGPWCKSVAQKKEGKHG